MVIQYEEGWLRDKNNRMISLGRFESDLDFEAFFQAMASVLWQKVRFRHVIANLFHKAI